MWVLTLTDLSTEIRTFDGSLNECLLTAISYNQVHENKYAGCFVIAKHFRGS